MKAEDTRFLLIDDERVFREQLALALSDRGFVVEHVGSGSEALCRQFAGIHRILLDLRMPQESGIDLLPRLKAAYPEAHVVVLTGYGSIPNAVECVRRGAKNFLTKPVTVDEILLAFDEQLRPGGLMKVPSLDEVECDHIHRVMSEYDGNISRAAKSLGLHRRSLQRKLEKISRTS